MKVLQKDKVRSGQAQFSLGTKHAPGFSQQVQAMLVTQMLDGVLTICVIERIIGKTKTLSNIDIDYSKPAEAIGVQPSGNRMLTATQM
jgi:hypothetical protein